MRRLFPYRLPKPESFNQRHSLDFSLLAAVILLTLFGLVIVYDASAIQAYQNFADRYYYLKQQALWSILGFLALIFFSFFDYQILGKFATPIFFLSIILLLMVNIPGFGVAALGAHRWLKVGQFTLQPAELIKLSSIIFFASLFQRKKNFWIFISVVGFISLVVGLLQRDLGSTVVFLLTALGMFFVSGAFIGYFFAILPLVAIISLILINLSSYRKQRVLAFLDPFADPQGFTYHISQILIALGSGGWFGLGIGQSRQKFSFIPEVSTDSIFSVIGEELGFVGSVILIISLGFVIVKAFSIAANAQGLFGKLLASGIALWLGAQTVVNLGAMVSLIPLTGVPLPFISYGGSALLANLVGIGILLNISKTTRV